VQYILANSRWKVGPSRLSERYSHHSFRFPPSIDSVPLSTKGQMLFHLLFLVGGVVGGGKLLRDFFSEKVFEELGL